jgi:peptidoglycan L-alanyl-D-glutamate endopeptidase CwlK
VAYSYGGAPLKAGIDRQPKKLLPRFARKIETLFQRLRARGYQPMLWEGYRTPERAAELEQRGTGIRLSMHSLGAAVDVVDGSTGNPWKASPGFWRALGEEAEKLGLTWGGRWKSKDMPHVQAIPVSQQTVFRAMTHNERNQIV